jgi:hypothetical protein
VRAGFVRSGGWRVAEWERRGKVRALALIRMAAQSVSIRLITRMAFTDSVH